MNTTAIDYFILNEGSLEDLHTIPFAQVQSVSCVIEEICKDSLREREDQKQYSFFFRNQQNKWLSVESLTKLKQTSPPTSLAGEIVVKLVPKKIVYIQDLLTPFLMHEIFKELPIKDLLSCIPVCKSWKKIAGDEYLWKTIFQLHFNAPEVPRISWKKHVIEREREFCKLETKLKKVLWLVEKGFAPRLRDILSLYFSNTPIENLCNEEGWNLLYIAARHGHISVVKLLIDCGAPIEQKLVRGAAIGVTPLYAASMKGHTDVVKLFLEMGADFNVSITEGESKGATPLYVAAYNGHLNVVKLLVDRGANLEAPNKNGATPLYLAAQSGHLPVVKYLLESGANPKAMLHNSSFTPYDIAMKYNHAEVARVLDNFIKAKKL